MVIPRQTPAGTRVSVKAVVESPIVSVKAVVESPIRDSFLDAENGGVMVFTWGDGNPWSSGALSAASLLRSANCPPNDAENGWWGHGVYLGRRKSVIESLPHLERASRKESQIP